jgi:two-component system, OmpR family, sensor histidine kinase VicK
MEVKDDSKEAISTAAALGWSTYSNSQAIVLSYVSIFETLWRQTELYEQLQQADHIKTEFINIAAHELRTPIMPIIGYAELLEEEEEDNKKRESIAAIIRNAKRLQRLANDILDATIIESNTLNIKKEQLNLNDLILNVLEDIIVINNTKEEKLKGVDNSSSNNNRRKILYNASEKEEVIIEANRIRLIQVISNLIDNAIKFTNEEDTISIMVEKKKENNNNINNNDNKTKEEKQEKEIVIVSVKDTGTGIDSEILPRLFSKFASKSYKGTGLGLFISKSIIEDHGGKMWAENNADGEKGATFSFSLPIINQ